MEQLLSAYLFEDLDQIRDVTFQSLTGPRRSLRKHISRPGDSSLGVRYLGRAQKRGNLHLRIVHLTGKLTMSLQSLKQPFQTIRLSCLAWTHPERITSFISSSSSSPKRGRVRGICSPLARSYLLLRLSYEYVSPGLSTTTSVSTLSFITRWTRCSGLPG